MKHGRERNTAIKRAVYDCTCFTPGVPYIRPSQIRVSLGQGTARSWATIRTPRALTEDEREAITKRLLNEELIGTYWDDMFPVQHPCVHLTSERKS